MDANSLEKLNYELDRDADLREVNPNVMQLLQFISDSV